MKKRTGLLLVCALLAALLLSGCSGQKQAEYRADVQSGVSYLQSLETIDPDTVTQKLRQMRLEKLQAERAAREQALLDDIDTVWQEFSDAVILGDSRAVGFSYYSFLDASRVLASSGERIDAIGGHIEDLKKLDPAYIFLCYGINDLGWYGSAQDYADTLLEKIRLLRRELPELKSSNFNIRSFGERVALNTPIQGTAADIIKLAMLRVDAALKKQKLKARLVLQVHDELIVECPVKEAEQVKKIVTAEMENVAQLRVPLLAEAKVGASWYEAK